MTALQRIKELEHQLLERDRTILALQHVNEELTEAINQYGRDEDFEDGTFKQKETK